jgi:putative transposase
MDHKGDFLLGNRKRCYPFTLLDAASRLLLACRAFPSTRGSLVKKALKEAFKEYGLPEAIRSDNGPPFASPSFTGLTELAVWLIELGIRLDRIQPGKPQQNGRLERFHRTVKEGCITPPAASMPAQQKRFDSYRVEYNEVRPHQSLGQRPPASVYEPSPRKLPARVTSADYGDAESRRVTASGWACFYGWRVPFSHTLKGKLVGFVPVEEDVYEIYFYNHKLAVFFFTTGTVTNGVQVKRCFHRKRWE